MSNTPGILLCNCSDAAVTPAVTREQVATGLRAAGVAFTLVEDLCRLAAHRDPQLVAFAQTPTPTVIACYPRAVRWLFAAAGASLPEPGTRFLNLRQQSAAEILAAVTPGAATGAATVAPPIADAWTPWFPVIDHGRCINCGQCLDFCLFGVYERDDTGCVAVRNPQHCKTNCPACARICPEVAIIFPKHDQPPINGAEITDESGERAKVGVSREAVLGDDVYAALAQRRAKAKLRLLRTPP